MKIASFGTRIHGPQVEAVDFSSERPAADFEASFYDLEGVIEAWLKGEVYESRQHGVLSTGSYQALLDTLERRAKEMRKLVDQGHPVVLFPAELPALKYVDRKGKWLDVADLRSRFPASVNAVRAGKGKLESRDFPALARFAHRLGMQSAAELLRDEKRWVLSCPRPGTEEGWNDFAAAFGELYEATGADAQMPALPDWHEQYLIPGEVEVADVIAQIEKAVGELNVLLAAKREEKTRLGYLKRLFTDKGSSLGKAVQTALEGLGFKVEPGPGGRDDLLATFGQAVAVVQVAGKDAKSANDADATQLDKAVTRYFDEHGVLAKGILVVNGFRDTAIGARSEAVFPAQMLGYSKKRGHCLITGLQLLCLYFDARKNDSAGRCRFELLDSVGPFPRFTGEQWKGVVSAREATPKPL